MADEQLRVGFLYGGKPATRAIPATYEFSAERGIRLQIPFTHEADDSNSDWYHAEDENPRKYLIFQDHQLAIHLLGCKNAGFTHALHGGQGYLKAAYAVEDNDAAPGEYASVHRMRSTIAGLYDFVGLESKSIDVHRDEDGLISGATINITRHDSVELGTVGKFYVNLQPHWSVEGEGRDRSEVVETTWIQTESEQPEAIEDHLLVHRAFRDFLALAYWQPVDFLEHEVEHHDSPARVMTGAPIGPAWRPVRTNRTLRARATEKRSFEVSDATALARFNQIGADGLHSWFAVHRTWDRAIDPLVGLLFSKDARLDVALLQAGVSMEAYGYIAALGKFLPRNEAASLSYKQRLRRTVDALPFDLSALVLDDLDSWTQRASDAYNAVKHANRNFPNTEEVILILLTTILILRVSFLHLTGIPDGELATSVPNSHMWSRLRQRYAQSAPSR